MKEAWTESGQEHKWDEYERIRDKKLWVSPTEKRKSRNVVFLFSAVLLAAGIAAWRRVAKTTSRP